MKHGWKYERVDGHQVTVDYWHFEDQVSARATMIVNGRAYQGHSGTVSRGSVVASLGQWCGDVAEAKAVAIAVDNVARNFRSTTPLA